MPQHGFFNRSVLVVDASGPSRKPLCRVLRAQGFANVYEAQNGTEALNHLARHRIDLMICEWALVPMPGAELARRIRRDEKSSHREIPIIMLTGHSELARVIEARDMGVTEFLRKPVSMQVLLERLRVVLEMPRSFVKATAYVGPDRRRRDAPPPRERRGAAIPQAAGADGPG